MPAEESYSTAVSLCRENLGSTEKGFGVPRCNDLSILLLNRGSLRLNNGMQKEALDDLETSSVLRGKPEISSNPRVALCLASLTHHVQSQTKANRMH